MKKLIFGLILCTTLMGCTRTTDFGTCIGVNDTPKEGLVYKVSIWNVFLGIIFSETIVVPLVVVFDQFRCPVEREISTRKDDEPLPAPPPAKTNK